MAAPTGNYDISLLDQSGHDVLEGVGQNRSLSATEHALIVYSGTSVNPVVDESDTLTLVVANNAVASAVVQIDLYVGLGA